MEWLHNNSVVVEFEDPTQPVVVQTELGVAFMSPTYSRLAASRGRDVSNILTALRLPSSGPVPSDYDRRILSVAHLVSKS